MTDDERRQHHWSRRSRAAQEGRHLPSVGELIRGMCFLSNELAEDAKTWAERVAPKVKHADLRRAFASLTVGITVDDVRATLALFDAILEASDGVKLLRNAGDLGDIRVRLLLYAAVLGDQDAARQVAAMASDLAAAPGDERGDYAAAAIGWLRESRSQFWSGSRTQQQAVAAGRRLLVDAAKGFVPERSPTPTKTEGELPGELPRGGDAAGRVVVVRSIGSPETAEGRRVRTAYGDIVCRPLPLVRVPDDLSAIREILIAEFPHAASIVDVLLAALDVRDYIKIRPTVLVGPPGSGKTTFAMRVFEILGVPQDLVSGPNHQDGSFSGTPRRWQSTAPCSPIALIKRTGFANPAVVVDEIEKASQSRHHGQLHDVLLTMLEPVTSRAWPDPHFEAPVDLSCLNWLATANSLEGISAPLRDRMRIIRFPSPTSEHLEPLAASMLRRTVIERGLDERWVEALDGEELEALRKAWPGGSLRKLQRLVEGVMAARDQWQSRMAN